MRIRVIIFTAVLALVAAACSDGATSSEDGTLTVYSGRSEELVQPLIERFEEESGISVSVRYAGSAELAATILEEGDNSPADVFFAQDPASLGAVALDGRFIELDDELLAAVDPVFSDGDGRWVGVSGRSRVVIYDASRVDPTTLPSTEDDFIGPEWAGRVAVAPTNGSFLAFVAAKILIDGEDATKAWLEGLAANDAPTFSGNSVIVEAVDTGAAEVGLVNHYYLLRRLDELGEVTAANHYLAGGAGALVMPTGVGILASSERQDTAARFVEFLLGAEAQEYFANETFEYPLSGGVPANEVLPPLESLNPPDVDLSRLAEVLDRATDLVAEAGLL